MLPSLSALCSAMAGASRLHVESLENIGIHYARTLRLWRQRFLENWDHIRTLGFDDTFRRMWLYYLCFCEAAFATRTLNDLQLVLSRPNNPALDREVSGDDGGTYA
ncbi:Mycolic acid cyclopropane synthetase [Desulfacinum infernum DSM 9756]|uniref:Mycolic acid cyclopropane synthetase n=1 Tax=Desulfacinum infernum DSM 9756 TaxID=1121391 RepID=A0A1M5FV67_9BACT|nr:Mycolic acid cyclopropane synthetase [Desulfacinum infernum DSM 9756]